VTALASERAAAFPAWWATRTSRERVLLGVLAALTLAIAVWYGLVTPVLKAEAAAEERHARAVERLLSVSAAAQEVTVLKGAASPSGRALEATVTQTALANAVPIAQQTPAGNGDLAVTVGAVEPGAAFRWLALLQRDHGVGVAALALSRNPDRSLRLQIRFSGGTA
jgi:general secretion pathway protein M